MAQPRIRWAIALLFLAQVCAVPGTHTAAAENISVALSPKNLTVPFGARESDYFDLILKNAGKEPASVWIIPRRLLQPGKARTAEIEFKQGEALITPVKGRKDRFKASLPTGESRISFRAVKVTSLGTYKGTIDIVEPDTEKLLVKSDISILKEKRDLLLALQGYKEKEGLALTPRSSDQRVFPVILQNTGESFHELTFDSLTLRGEGLELPAKAIGDIELEANQSQPVILDFSEHELPVSGTYSGTLTVRDKSIKALAKVFKIELAPLVMNLEIRGKEADKPVEFTATAADHVGFDLWVKKAAGEPDRTLEVTGAVRLDAGKDAGVSSEQAVELSGADWRPIRIKFDTETMPASGDHEGWLMIVDKNDPRLTQSMSLKLIGNYSTDRPVWLMVGVIALGSAVSFLFYIVLPRSIKRINLRQKMKALETRAADLAQFDQTHAGPAAELLRNKLEVDRARLRGSLKRAGALSPSYADRMADIDDVIKSVTTSLDRLWTIGLLRQRIWSERSIPFSLRDRFASDLRRAEWQLVQGDDEAAKTRLDELKLRLAGKEMIAEYRTSLSKQIADRLKPPRTGGELADEAWIKELIKDLRNYGAPNDIPEDQFDRLDREYAVVETYLDGFSWLERSGREVSAEKRKEILDLLRGGLTSGTQLRMARQLIRALHTGIGLDDVVEAAAAGEGKIELSGSEPRPGDLVSSHFRFNDERIEADYVSTARLDYIWNFGDGEALSRGKRCVHFYDEKTAGTELHIELDVVGPDGKTIKTYKGPAEGATVKVRATSKRPPDASYLEAAAFVIALVIASMVGINVQFEALTAAPKEPEDAFDYIKTYLPAFLWGFALDQAKGSFVSAFKKLRESPAGGAAGAAG